MKRIFTIKFIVKDTKVCLDFDFDWALAVVVSAIVNHIYKRSVMFAVVGKKSLNITVYI